MLLLLGNFFTEEGFKSKKLLHLDPKFSGLRDKVSKHRFKASDKMLTVKVDRIKQEFEYGNIELKYINTEQNPSDLLTETVDAHIL